MPWPNKQRLSFSEFPMVCINVVVGDRYPLVVCGVISVLGAETDFNVAASCCDGAECLEAIRNISPDIALLDMSMPGLGGLEILAAVASEGLSTRVVLFNTSTKDPELIVGIARGAYGLILRDTTPAVLVQCLRQVAAGQRIFPSQLPASGPPTQQGRFSRGAMSEAEAPALSPREHQIVRLVSEGLTNKEVARLLKLSDGTIKVHLHNIYQKLAIGNRTALAALAISRDERTNGGRERIHELE
jgi:two-component system, NarL family, nitrate/nitrite response regulator NarL